MYAAGSHSYVSKNFMDAYVKKKQKLQAKKEAPLKEAAPKRMFKEDAPLETIVEERSMMSSLGSMI